MSLLAGQILEKTTTIEGAEQALNNLDQFFNESSSPYSGKQNNELEEEFKMAWCPEFEVGCYFFMFFFMLSPLIAAICCRINK